MADVKCAHILIDGTVQGVGFRYFVQQQATAHNLTGWVRNRLDEKVEVLAQGDESQLQQLISVMWVGPALASVTRVDVEWSTPVFEYKRFSIAPNE